jgi:hypothetical protein
LPPVQIVPQLPQLYGLVSVFTHAPPHGFSPAAQLAASTGESGLVASTVVPPAAPLPAAPPAAELPVPLEPPPVELSAVEPPLGQVPPLPPPFPPAPPPSDFGFVVLEEQATMVRAANTQRSIGMVRSKRPTTSPVYRFA